MSPAVDRVTDAAVGLGGISVAVWVHYAENGLKWFALIGGAILLGLRIAIAVRELREKKKEDK